MFATDTKTETGLMCRAHDCPNNWHVMREGNMPLCSAHAWASKHQWDSITQGLLHAFTQTPLEPTKPYVPHVSAADKKRTVLALRQTLNARQFSQTDGKAWAKALKARHDAGERLNLNQIRSFEQALGVVASGAQHEID